ncbi:hypothetical protein Tco_0450736 [Tanacetum coccineum]
MYSTAPRKRDIATKSIAIESSFSSASFQRVEHARRERAQVDEILEHTLTHTEIIGPTTLVCADTAGQRGGLLYH